MKLRTHLSVNQSLSGKPVELSPGRCSVLLKTSEEMKADEKGLVHGGFLFSAADYAAMLAVNEPTVVLAGAQVKFLKPVKVGEEVLFKAKVIKEEGKKRTVEVEGFKGEEKVFEGTFLAVVPEKHVLER